MSEIRDSKVALPRSVASLLALHDEVFVRAAYLAILGREVDPDGLVNYLSQVRNGELKVQIAAELALSTEGKRNAVQLAGLQELLARPVRPEHSIWARVFKRVTAAAMQPLLRQLRIIDNTAARVDASLRQQTKQLAELASLLEHSRSATAPSAATPVPHRVGEAGEARRTVQAAQLSPVQRRLFLELKAAIAVKRGH